MPLDPFAWNRPRLKMGAPKDYQRYAMRCLEAARTAPNSAPQAFFCRNGSSVAEVRGTGDERSGRSKWHSDFRTRPRQLRKSGIAARSQSALSSRELGRCRGHFFPSCAYPNRVIGDPRGTVLPSDEVAVGTARTIIDDLLEDSGPGQPRPLVMVRNEAGEVVYRFPSN